MLNVLLLYFLGGKNQQFRDGNPILCSLGRSRPTEALIHVGKVTLPVLSISTAGPVGPTMMEPTSQPTAPCDVKRGQLQQGREWRSQPEVRKCTKLLIHQHTDRGKWFQGLFSS